MSLKKLTIVSTARMGHGTFEAKFKPLAQLSQINKIIVVRKDAGPKINKLYYKVLPKICKKAIFNLLITPFILIQEVKKNNADLILAYHYQPHFYFAFIASIMTGVPYIVAQTGTDAQETSRKLIIGKILKHVIKKAKYFNVPGKDTLEFWNESGIARNQLNILHSTIGVDVFKPRDIKKEFDVIFVGRLAEVKRIDKLINATKIIIKKYPKVKICIVGNGHLEKELKLQVQKLGLQENFVLSF